MKFDTYTQNMEDVPKPMKDVLKPEELDIIKFVDADTASAIMRLPKELPTEDISNDNKA